MLPGRWGNGTVECAGAAEYVCSAVPLFFTLVFLLFVFINVVSLRPRVEHIGFAGTCESHHSLIHLFRLLPFRTVQFVTFYIDASLRLVICIYHRYVGSAPIHRTSPVTSKEGKTAELNTTDAAVCEITAAFCARFVGEAAALRQATALGHDTTAL